MAYSTDPTSSLDLEKEKFILVAKDLINILGLECEICKEEYAMPDRTPKLLPCNHTICLPCLNRIVSSQCPVCRTSYYDSNPDDLPNDFKVVSGLDAIKKAKSAFRNVCMKHNCRSLDQYCAGCMLPVCSDCVRLDHSNDANDGHVIVSMARALEDNDGRFGDIEEKCKNNMDQFNRRKDNIETVKTNLGKLKEKMLREVEDKFNEYSALLLQRKESLVASIYEKIEKREIELGNETNRHEEHNTKVKTLYNSFKAARECNDLRDMFALQKEFVNNENELVDVTFSNEKLCESFAFKPVWEERFKTDLSALGDILSKIDNQLISAE